MDEPYVTYAVMSSDINGVILLIITGTGLHGSCRLQALLYRGQ